LPNRPQRVTGETLRASHRGLHHAALAAAIDAATDLIESPWTIAVASITIRNLDDKLKQHLRVRAAQHGRSMEEEARVILRQALSEDSAAPQDLGLAIHRRFAALGGVDLAVAPREAMRAPPGFDR
jgi:antitoxin FitA